MAQENLEILRRAYEAFGRGDLDAMAADVDPDVEYIPSGAIPGQADAFQGSEEFKRFFSWLFDSFDEGRLEARELFDVDDDRVLGGFTLSGRGKLSGAETSWTLWQIWTLEDGVIVRGQAFTDRDEAFDAAGLSP